MTRPVDVWRVCGRPVLPESPGCGCTCTPNDPSRRHAEKALDRLANNIERRFPVQSAPPAVRGAGEPSPDGS